MPVAFLWSWGDWLVLRAWDNENRVFVRAEMPMTNAIRIHETGGPEVLRWEAVTVGDLVRLFEAHKRENRELKSRVAALQADNTRLAGKLASAIRSVDAVLESLPEA